MVELILETSNQADLDEKNAKNIGVYGDHAHFEGGITFNQRVIDPFVRANYKIKPAFSG
ncbi:MAG: hypothetical protein GY841_06115 [FCB group bacterium]|nr:hypothetical protein [FCB group bacterium]